MKKFLLPMQGFLAILLLPFATVKATQQQSDVYDNLRLKPDTIVKQQVAFVQPGDSGNDMFWDFSQLDVIDDNYEVAYFIPENVKQDTLCGLENRTRYYYRYYGDTLSSIGYENPTTYVAYDSAEHIHSLSFQYGDTLTSHFQGKGIYGTDQHLHFSGTTKLKADAVGTIRLPDGDFTNVLRTYAFRQYHESGFDNTNMWKETYRWYTTGCPYPIFESQSAFAEYQVEGGTFVDTVEQVSFYYILPEDLIRKYQTLSTSYDSVSNPVDEIWANASFTPNPTHGDLVVRYTLKQDAKIGYSLHAASGLPMMQKPSVDKQSGDYTDYIDVSAFPSGNYTLYVFVDYYVIRQVIIKL